MTRRWPAVNIIIVPVPVQGDQAAGRIAAGLRAAAKIPGVDVIITGRGGGSLEDLWPFNEEVGARAIAKCPIPVVSAVGHEIDVSIADLVADRRALTPSEAGELVVPSADEFRQDLRNTASRMYRVLTGRVERLKLTLQAIEARSVFQRPMTLVDERRQRCDDLAARAERSIRLTVERLNQKLATTAAALDALSPMKVLARGYSLTMDAKGNLIRSTSDVTAGVQLQTRLPDGVIHSTAIEVVTE